MAVRIGSLELCDGLLLAPMAGVTDGPYRAVCRMHGAEATVTEMISAKALWYHDKKTRVLSRIAPDEAPCGVQIFGNEPECMAYAARVLTEETEDSVRPAFLDINMGCPVPKVFKNGEGSALLRDPVLAGRITAAVCAASAVPVTVKMRIGVTADTVNCVEVARAVTESGACMVTVHGRTTAQLYRPPVDYAPIAAVRAALPASVPVIGNGDILSGADALRMKKETGCDGLMLARGTLGNPFLFEEVRAALHGAPYTAPDTAARLAVAREQLCRMATCFGERAAMLRARKLLCWYSAGMRGGAALRRDICAVETLAGALLLLDTLAQNEKESRE